LPRVVYSSGDKAQSQHDQFSDSRRGLCRISDMTGCTIPACCPDQTQARSSRLRNSTKAVNALYRPSSPSYSPEIRAPSQLRPLHFGRLHQLFEEIPLRTEPNRRPTAGMLGIEQGETVVVLRREDEVLCAGLGLASSAWTASRGRRAARRDSRNSRACTCVCTLHLSRPYSMMRQWNHPGLVMPRSVRRSFGKDFASWDVNPHSRKARPTPRR
jgi:hypothetical protein